MIIKVNYQYNDMMGDKYCFRTCEIDITDLVKAEIDREIHLQDGAIDTVEIDVAETAKNVVKEHL